MEKFNICLYIGSLKMQSVFLFKDEFTFLLITLVQFVLLICILENWHLYRFQLNVFFILNAVYQSDSPQIIYLVMNSKFLNSKFVFPTASTWIAYRHFKLNIFQTELFISFLSLLYPQVYPVSENIATAQQVAHAKNLGVMFDSNFALSPTVSSPSDFSQICFELCPRLIPLFCYHSSARHQPYLSFLLLW